MIELEQKNRVPKKGVKLNIFVDRIVHAWPWRRTFPANINHERPRSPLIARPDQRQAFVNLEIDQVKGLSIVRVLAPPEGTGEVRIRLFLNLGQEEPFAYELFTLFHEKIGRMGIGFEVFMGQPFTHDKGYRIIVHHMGS